MNGGALPNGQRQLRMAALAIRESSPSCSFAFGTRLLGFCRLARALAKTAANVPILNNPTIIRRYQTIANLGIDADKLGDGDSRTVCTSDAFELLVQPPSGVILPMESFPLAQKIAHELLGGVHDTNAASATADSRREPRQQN
jgi:hypothetical protein